MIALKLCKEDVNLLKFAQIRVIFDDFSHLMRIYQMFDGPQRIKNHIKQKVI